MASADTELQDEDVSVEVVIGALSTGALSMSVADDETTLTEATSSDPAIREFTGDLPLVTVTDTRDTADIAPGVGWYVLGSATDFIGDGIQPAISKANFGWTPFLGAGVDENSVSEGDPVGTALDATPDDGFGEPGDPGTSSHELLVGTIDSAGIVSEGSWTAGAGLVLKAPATVAAGTYTAVLTLSLFE
jgi:hypothetical protein